MRNTWIALVFGAGLVVGPSTLSAHRSFAAEDDGNKAVSLKGTVTKVDWVNPHSWVYIDVTDSNGKVTNWSCETAPPYYEQTEYACVEGEKDLQHYTESEGAKKK